MPAESDAVAAYTEARDNLTAAEPDALAELLAAKEAHAAAGTDDTRDRKRAAAERLRLIRHAVRGNRTTAVAGDAFVVTAEESEG